MTITIPQTSNDDVEKYYTTMVPYYYLFWSDKRSLGIHYGLWDGGAQNHSEALIHQYRVIAETLGITPSDQVLDAGCGYGGGAIWIAEHYGATCTGITLSSKQVREAARNAHRRGVSQKTRFLEMDYTQTTFPDNTFHHVFGIESFCHSYPDSTQLFREMYRILKPGGKLFMSDGFRLREPQSREEELQLKDFCRGWCLSGMNTPAQTRAALDAAGFCDILFTDKKQAATSSSEEVYRIGQRAYRLLKPLQWLRLIPRVVTDNIYAARSQKQMWDSGLMGYGSFVATK